MTTIAQRFDMMVRTTTAQDFFNRIGMTPLFGGVFFATLWGVAVLSIEAISGRLFVERSGDELETFLVELGLVLILGELLVFVVAAMAAHENRTDRTIEELKLLPEVPRDGIDRTEAALNDYGSVRLATVALSGFAFAFMAPILEFPIVGNYDAFNPAHWSAEVYVHRIVGPVLGAGVALLVHVIISDSVRFWELAREITSIELTDLGRYMPFTNQGLSNAAIVIGFVAPFAFVAIVDRYVLLVASITLYGVVAAFVGLFLPVWALRERIQIEKAKEAAWCHKRIPEARAALRDSKPGAGQDLAGLLMYLKEVNEVHAWPIAPGGIARFTLFLLIPLGSWGGGALVERMVDSALG
ncbi:MAG: hypothetical protein P1U69_03870 [Parvibaculaceae bacterium]|nr:hypothetical protein [Parvibaculaceae bacterium]